MKFRGENVKWKKSDTGRRGKRKPNIKRSSHFDIFISVV